jgi:hypothetical protein
MFLEEFLEEIEWNIQFKPTILSVYIRNHLTHENISHEQFNEVVIDLDDDIFLELPLNDEYTCFKTIKINGKQTLKSLLTKIYNFYNSKIDPELIDDIFEESKELYEELVEDKSDLQYVDAFMGSVCPPVFIGLKQSSKKNHFSVELGPI